MRRPRWASAAAIRSIACAICRRSSFTARATLASSRLMMRAISSADLRSRSAEAKFVFSVPRRRSSAVFALRVNVFPSKFASPTVPVKCVSYQGHAFRRAVSRATNAPSGAGGGGWSFTTGSQVFNHRVAKRRAYLFDGLVLAVGPGAIGEQSYRKLVVRVDPQGCAGVTEMSEGTGREVFSGLRGKRERVPAERSGSAFGGGFPARKEFDGCRAEDGVSAIEHGVGEDG